MPQRSSERVGDGLHTRLLARHSEIETALLTRVLAVSGRSPTEDPEYAEGLRAATIAALDHCLTALELGEERSPPPPPGMLAQARLAGRSGVSLDTVLRRLFAGHALIADFLVEEAGRAGLSPSATQRLLRIQANVFDRLVVAVSEEHARESEGRLRSAQQRNAERVERLLAGELLDASELSYDFEGHHRGMIAQGQGALEAVHETAAGLDCLLLSVPRAEGAVWAWLGSRRPLEPSELGKRLTERWPSELALALGEPTSGMGGWRLTHRQAKAALPVALRSPGPPTRYAEVALLAAIVKDDLLSTSLRELYLVPLQNERDGGEVSRKTLRAYFAAECNVSSAAAVLGVSRQTVAKRLRLIEGRIGRTLSACAADLDAALRLHDLDRMIESRQTTQ
jgi:PucR-like helix-turn-helix protein/diguanylate cyclase with GGDEF domain